MPEMVTKKKNHMNLWLVLGSGVLAVLSYVIVTKVLKVYLLKRITDDLTTGGRIGYFLLCAGLYLAELWLVEIFFGEGMKWLMDRESYVAIRKSSLENPRAVLFYEEYRKKMRKITFWNQMIMNVILVGLLMLFTLKGGSASEFQALVILVCILALLNPVDRNFRKKEKAKRDKILYEDCDPALAYDVHELFRMDPMMRQERNMHLMQQAIACFYLCDYREMRRKLDCMEKVLLQNVIALQIGLKGLASIDEGRPDLYQQCVAELDLTMQRLKMTVATQKVFNEVRKDWQGRLDLSSEDPSRAEPYVREYMAQGKKPIFWMDATFQMAWIQLSRGEKEQARANLQLVGERAGTMDIRDRAVRILRSMNENS